MTSNRSGSKPSALSPAVEALVAAERVPSPQPEAVRARALSRAREALLHAPAAPQSLPGARAGVSRVVMAAAAGIALVAGVATVAHLMGRAAPGSPSGASTQQVASTPSVPPPAVPEAAPSLEVVTRPSATPAAVASTEGSSPSHRPIPSSRQDSGPEELQLLNRARQADAHGDYAGALVIVSEHERSYPAGRLSEEREVLRVKALVGLGRGGEARRAAARFHRQFPRSVLLRKVDEMLASLP